MGAEQKEPLQKMNSVTEFLSGITGLPITHCSIFPEIEEIAEKKPTQTNYPYSFKLTLGDEREQYDIYAKVTMTDKDSPGAYLRSTLWKVQYNREQIFNSEEIEISKSFSREMFFNKKKMVEILGEELTSAVRGPDAEYAFMDYETYTLESLRGNHNYFKNIYLVLMTHMKKRGLELPPILSKNEQIREAMRMGDIESIKRILSTILLFDSATYDARCQAHMKKEAEIITEATMYQYNKRNPLLPIEHSYPNVEFTVVKGNEKSSLRPSNILVVENNLDLPGFFVDSVKKRLEADGRYAGTKLIREINLSLCMDYCESGKIQMIVFDWLIPSYEEIVELRGDNPVFRAFYGNDQAEISLENDGMHAALSNGMLLDEKGMQEEEERIDIRSKWMSMISDACRRSGVNTPEHMIVRTDEQLKNIAQTLSIPLGKR